MQTKHLNCSLNRGDYLAFALNELLVVIANDMPWITGPTPVGQPGLVPQK
jgi:hypothetical protein